MRKLTHRRKHDLRTDRWSCACGYVLGRDGDRKLYARCPLAKENVGSAYPEIKISAPPPGVALSDAQPTEIQAVGQKAMSLVQTKKGEPTMTTEETMKDFDNYMKGCKTVGCPTCGGKGTITSKVLFEELNKRTTDKWCQCQEPQPVVYWLAYLEVWDCFSCGGCLQVG